jgi:hypothetical protein
LRNQPERATVSWAYRSKGVNFKHSNKFIMGKCILFCEAAAATNKDCKTQVKANRNSYKSLAFANQFQSSECAEIVSGKNVKHVDAQ